MDNNQKSYITAWIVFAIIMMFTVLAVPSKALAAAAATITPEKMTVDLVVDGKTLKFQDTNGNKKPDPVELTVIQGKLFTPGTNKTEIGTYRCTFPFEGWVNSTDGIPVTLSTQIFDFKGKGMIVVVGDEPSAEAVGKPVIGVIAGGTGEFFAVRGTASLTTGEMQGTNFPGKVVFDLIRG